VLAKEPWALCVAFSISKALRNVRDRMHTPRPVMCVACSSQFTDIRMVPEGFLIWLPGPETTPEQPDPLGIAQAVCPACARRKDDKQLLEYTVELLQKVFHDGVIVAAMEDFE
jgi:hypothetical protein